MKPPLLAIDPGTAKCGMAVVDAHGKVLFQAIIATDQIQQNIEELLEKWAIQQVVYGRSTGSKKMHKLLLEIQQSHKSTFAIDAIDERNSTLEARHLYWQDNPRTGLLKLIPLSLLAPPQATDDYAAIVLARRFLGVE